MKTGIFHLNADTPFTLWFLRSAGVATTDTKHACEWNVNEISEFVTRLGFLSSKEEMSRNFVYIHEVYIIIILTVLSSCSSILHLKYILICNSYSSYV